MGSTIEVGNVPTLLPTVVTAHNQMGVACNVHSVSIQGSTNASSVLGVLASGVHLSASALTTYPGRCCGKCLACCRQGLLLFAVV